MPPTPLFQAVLNNGTLLLTAILAMAAVASAVAAWWAARQTMRTTQAQLLIQFLEQYASQEMHAALKFLGELRDKQPDILRAVQMGVRMAPPEFHPSRRKVKYYFCNAYRLYKSGHLTKKSLDLVMTVAGASILHEIIEPWEVAHGKLEFDKTWCQELRRICPPGEF